MAKPQLPPEAAIHDKAEELGLIEAGQVPSSVRSRVAKLLMAEDAAPERPSTAQQLADFMAELEAVGITDSELIARLATEAVRVLIARGGLIHNRTKE